MPRIKVVCKYTGGFSSPQSSTTVTGIFILSMLMGLSKEQLLDVILISNRVVFQRVHLGETGNRARFLMYIHGGKEGINHLKKKTLTLPICLHLDLGANWKRRCHMLNSRLLKSGTAVGRVYRVLSKHISQYNETFCWKCLPPHYRVLSGSAPCASRLCHRHHSLKFSGLPKDCSTWASLLTKFSFRYVGVLKWFCQSPYIGGTEAYETFQHQIRSRTEEIVAVPFGCSTVSEKKKSK